MLNNFKVYIFLSIIFVVLIILLLSVNSNYNNKMGKNLNYVYDTFYYRLYKGSKYYNNLFEDESLEQKLKNENDVIILFDALWCKECKELRRKELLYKLGETYKVYIVNDRHPCVENYQKSLNFKKFPTLFVYKNEKFINIKKINYDDIIKELKV